jgi:N-carbamoylputrescine amidase
MQQLLNMQQLLKERKARTAMETSNTRKQITVSIGMVLLTALLAQPRTAAGDQKAGAAAGYGRVQLAGIQISGHKGQKDENIQTMTRMIRSAAAKGAQIVLTPEMALSGFMNTAEEKRLAEPIPGPSTEIFGRLAKELDIYILLAMPEQRGDDYCNAVAIIGRDGNVMGIYRKIVVNATEAATGCLGGDNLDVWRFETETGALTAGINICADMGNPENARVPTLKGAEVIFHPLGSYPGDALHRSTLVTRAYENEIIIFLVNHAAPRLNGTSMVSGYRGEIIAEAGKNEEVFFFEADIDALNRHRLTSGRGQHFRRPELYSVLTDPAKQIHPLNANLPLSSKHYRGIMVDHRPNILILSVNEKNAACPDILLRSTDSQPFTVTGFESPDDCITAEFDSSLQDSKIVLRPTVDMAKLKQSMKGQIRIGVTHPQSNTVSIDFDTSPIFASEPPEVVIRGAKPGQPAVREIIVRNNYQQYFEIAGVQLKSGSPLQGSVRLVGAQLAGTAWKLRLEIQPPEPRGDAKTFTDALVVHIKGGQTLEIPCSGIY